MSPQEQEAHYGKLWNKAWKVWNAIIKSIKLSQWIANYGTQCLSLISGLRRVTKPKAGNDLLWSQNKKNHKIYPIIDWDDQTIYHHSERKQLTLPSYGNEGYVSVGDWHSTSPLKPNMTPEETRFNGLKRMAYTSQRELMITKLSLWKSLNISVLRNEPPITFCRFFELNLLTHSRTFYKGPTAKFLSILTILKTNQRYDLLN